MADERPLAQCIGKFAYETMRDGIMSIERMRDRKSRLGQSTRDLKCYKCPTCHAFHIGHNNPHRFFQKRT